MKTVREMALEVADLVVDKRGREEFSFDRYGLERFAALVRAQALEEAVAAILAFNENECDTGFGMGKSDAVDAIRALVKEKS